MTPNLKLNEIRALVVDDMAMSRVTSQRLLGEIGIQNIEVAVNGDDAWTVLLAAKEAGNPFHLVVSDWMMPVMNGIDLLKKIKSSDWAIKPPLILATAESDVGQVALAVKEGIAGYLRKPLSIDALRAIVEKVVGAKA